jgi:response regulator of citrate/malate metabolism
MLQRVDDVFLHDHFYCRSKILLNPGIIHYGIMDYLYKILAFSHVLFNRQRFTRRYFSALSENHFLSVKISGTKVCSCIGGRTYPFSFFL